MSVIKHNFYTPGSRWRKLSTIINTLSKSYKVETSFTHRSTSIGGFRNSRKKTLRYKIYHMKYTQIEENKNILILWDFYSSRFLKKEFVILKNIFSHIFTRYSTNMSYPGQLFFPLGILADTFKSKLINRIIPLYFIPLNSNISLISNNNKNGPSYAKAPGSTAQRLRLNKKIKLIEIMLPSKTLKLYSITSTAVWAWTESTNNRVVLGKWGLNYLRLKKLNVRGVAKNPVDHPNGGRTKAKQPELTPWGWVAKCNK